MEFRCSHCGRRYRAGGDVTGRRVSCKACGSDFTIRAAAPPESMGDEWFGDDLPAPGPLPDAPPAGVFTQPLATPSPHTSMHSTPLNPHNSTSDGDDRFTAGTSTIGSAGASMAGGQANTGRRRADEIDYEIFGTESQYVEITLDPGERAIAEAGALMFMSDGIEMATTAGDGSQTDQGFFGKAVQMGKRALTGESLFMTTFTNTASTRATVAFGSPYPGKMIPMHLDQLGGQIICQKDAFLCGARGISVDIAFQKKIGAGLFGGEGFIMQRLSGDGIAITHAGGTMMYRELDAGERLRLDTGCLMALGPSVQYDIEFVGGLKNAFFGGEGLFMATVRGPGPVWLQSLPFSRLAGRITSMAGGKFTAPSGGEGSLLGGLGDMLMGD